MAIGWKEETRSNRGNMRPMPKESRKGGECYKEYVGVDNRSVFYPKNSSVGNTFTFDVVEDAGSNLAPNVFIIETLARARSLKTYLAGFLGIETKRVGQRTVVYATDD